MENLANMAADTWMGVSILAGIAFIILAISIAVAVGNAIFEEFKKRRARKQPAKYMQELFGNNKE